MTEYSLAFRTLFQTTHHKLKCFSQRTIRAGLVPIRRLRSHLCRDRRHGITQEPHRSLPRPWTQRHTETSRQKKKKNEKKRAHPPWAPPCPVLRENPTRSSGGRVSAMAATSPPLKVATASAAAVATQTRAGCASLGKKRKSCGSHLRCEQRQQRQPWLPSRCRPCRRVCQPLAVATHSHWGCRQQ